MQSTHAQPTQAVATLLPQPRWDQLLATLQQHSDNIERHLPGDKRAQDAAFLVFVGVQLELLVRDVFGPEAEAQLITLFDSRCGVARPDLALVVNNTQQVPA